MRVRISTWNVRSILTDERRRKVFESLRKTKSDVFCVQETWLRNDDNKILERWSGPKGYTSIGDGSHSAGVAILCRRWIQNLNPTFGTIIPGRAIYMDIDIGSQGRMRVINIYNLSGASTSKERQEVRRKISEEMTDHSILCGDWNNVEEPDYDTTGHGFCDRKFKEWKLQNRLEDPWRRLHPGFPGFTCRTGNRGGTVWSRLDRFYEVMKTKGWIRKIEMEPIRMSDHYMVTVGIDTAKGVSNSRWRMNPEVLEIEGVIEEITAQIQNIVLQRNTQIGEQKQPGLIWAEVKEAAIKLLKKAARKKAIDERRAEKELRQILIVAQRKAVFSGAQEDRANLMMAEDRMMEHKERKNKNMDDVLQQLVRQKDEKQTKYFFRKKGGKDTTLDIGVVDNGEDLFVTAEEINAEVQRYYQCLWDAEPIEESTLEEILQERKTLDRNIAQEMSLNINAQDVDRAIMSMKEGKSPGPDGLSAEFYKKTKDVIIPILINIIKQVENGGELPEGFTQANVRLVPKKGDMRKLSNWRPITLANVDYKIMASCVKRKIEVGISSILEEEQVGFMKGRRITEHTYALQAIYDYDREFKIEGGYLLLDQEKAYDRVDHRVILKVLEERGFPGNICNLVKQTYNSAKVQVIVNGGLTQVIIRRRGVFQGCPCAPLLYNLAADLLAVEVKREITGIKIVDNRSVKICMYADDTLIFLNGPEDARKAYDVLNKYNRATGSRTNMDKSTGTVFSGDGVENYPEGVAWKKTNVPVKYLGAVYCDNTQGAAPYWNSLKDKILNGMECWKRRRLSSSGKVIVWNSLLLTKLKYAINTGSPPPGWIEEIDSDMKKWMVPPRNAGRLNCYMNPPHEGGLGLTSTQTAYVTLKTRWINDLLTSPKGNWQEITWTYIKKCNPKKVRVWSTANLRDAAKGHVSFIRDRINLAVKLFDFPKKEVLTRDIIAGDLAMKEGQLMSVIEVGGDDRIQVALAKIGRDGTTKVHGEKEWIGADVLRVVPSSIKEGFWETRPTLVEAVPAPYHVMTKGKVGLGMRLCMARTRQFKSFLRKTATPRKSAAEYWRKLVEEDRVGAGRGRETDGNIYWDKVWAQAKVNLLKPSHRVLMLHIVWRDLYMGERREHVTKQNSICSLCGQGPDYMLHVFYDCALAKRAWYIAMQAMRLPQRLWGLLSARVALLGDIEPFGIGTEALACLRAHALGALWAARIKRQAMDEENPHARLQGQWDIANTVIMNTLRTANLREAQDQKRRNLWNPVRRFCQELRDIGCLLRNIDEGGFT